MTDEQKSSYKDLLKSQGWIQLKAHLDEQIQWNRLMACQQKITLEDRLWHSAFAMGQEYAANYLEILLKENLTTNNE